MGEGIGHHRDRERVGCAVTRVVRRVHRHMTGTGLIQGRGHLQRAVVARAADRQICKEQRIVTAHRDAEVGRRRVGIAHHKGSVGAGPIFNQGQRPQALDDRTGSGSSPARQHRQRKLGDDGVAGFIRHNDANGDQARGVRGGRNLHRAVRAGAAKADVGRRHQRGVGRVAGERQGVHRRIRIANDKSNRGQGGVFLDALVANRADGGRLRDDVGIAAGNCINGFIGKIALHSRQIEGGGGKVIRCPFNQSIHEEGGGISRHQHVCIVPAAGTVINVVANHVDIRTGIPAHRRALAGGSRARHKDRRHQIKEGEPHRPRSAPHKFFFHHG